MSARATNGTGQGIAESVCGIATLALTSSSFAAPLEEDAPLVFALALAFWGSSISPGRSIVEASPSPTIHGICLIDLLRLLLLGDV
eukprot:4224385-Amphidinium_carterae.1